VKTGEALIYITEFSYISASIASIVGYPALEGLHPLAQSAIFAGMAGALHYARTHPENKAFRKALSALYGCLAPLSFTGIQKWKSYIGDPSILGPAMALWDLALAIALLQD